MIRCGYHALLVWHILWAILLMMGDPQNITASMWEQHLPLIKTLYHVWTGVVALTIPLGIAGFVCIWRRTGMAPPVRSYRPWIAIFLWYALIGVHPGLFDLLQIFHALQYLIFPLRVEVNQYSTTRDVTETRAILHGIAYYLVLVIVGLVVFEGPSISQVWGDKNFALQALIASAVNIHHYMIDGVIWKLRNPEVRKTLFAHLTPS
ncbi:MAG: hypothetical protein ABGZ53_21640 [Fuerstiella sp.]